MAFVVDGAQWRFDGWRPEEVSARVEAFLDLVETLIAEGDVVWVGDDFQALPMRAGLDLWSLFSDASDVPLSPEVRQELAAWLGTASYYVDEDNWPDGLDEASISIDGEPAVENNDVAWAHHSVRQGRTVACLSLVRDGALETTSALGSTPVFFVSNEVDQRAFWRDAIVLKGDGLDALQDLASRAFPRLFFAKDVLSALRTLPGGYVAIRERLKAALTVLDEHGRWIFQQPPPALRPNEAPGPDPSAKPSNQIVERRFLGFGLDVAPENPNVRLSRVPREAREIVVGVRTLYCEWHIKLEPHRNRIHIHEPTPESGGRVVVAIIHEHLPLP